jgi:hypothetical protein
MGEMIRAAVDDPYGPEGLFRLIANSCRMRLSVSTWRSQVAVVALVLSVALALCGMLVWNMTTTAYFGPPGHFTRSVRHQIYPHRAEALWVAALLSAAVGGFAIVAARRSKIRTPRPA